MTGAFTGNSRHHTRGPQPQDASKSSRSGVHENASSPWAQAFEKALGVAQESRTVTSLKDIVKILSLLGNGARKAGGGSQMGYIFLPSKGGHVFSGARLHRRQKGAAFINCDSQERRVRPVRLQIEQMCPDHTWSYVRLETDPADDPDTMLPGYEPFEGVNVYVIFWSRSPYAIDPRTYDARHASMSVADFRDYICKCMQLLSEAQRRRDPSIPVTRYALPLPADL